MPNKLKDTFHTLLGLLIVVAVGVGAVAAWHALTAFLNRPAGQIAFDLGFIGAYAAAAFAVIVAVLLIRYIWRATRHGRRLFKTTRDA